MKLMCTYSQIIIHCHSIMMYLHFNNKTFELRNKGNSIFLLGCNFHFQIIQG
jgi:hypothetical protein